MIATIKLDPSFRKNGEWDTHSALKTVSHDHYSEYDSEPSCDLMIVETGDGKFYIGESFDGDGRGHPKVFCVSGESNIIELYDTFEEAENNIIQVLSELTGFPVENLNRHRLIIHTKYTKLSTILSWVFAPVVVFLLYVISKEIYFILDGIFERSGLG